MPTNKPEVVLQELARRAIPFLRDEGANYEDDGSNEPLELAREIESVLSENPNRDAANPGGCECEKCGRVFIGAEWHSLCGVCVDTLTRPAAGERMPTVPQAFFDEFGVNADDRVMDYGRACYDAGALSAAPQQPGQEIVDAPLDATDNADYIRHCADKLVSLGYRTTGECLRAIANSHAHPQQPAEAVAPYLYEVRWIDGVTTYPKEKPSYCGNALVTPLYREPPPAIDIGKLRELVARWRADASGGEGYNYTKYEEGRIAEKRARASELAALIGDGGERANG